MPIVEVKGPSVAPGGSLDFGNAAAASAAPDAALARALQEQGGQIRQDATRLYATDVDTLRQQAKTDADKEFVELFNQYSQPGGKFEQRKKDAAKGLTQEVAGDYQKLEDKLLAKYGGDEHTYRAIQQLSIVRSNEAFDAASNYETKEVEHARMESEGRAAISKADMLMIKIRNAAPTEDIGTVIGTLDDEIKDHTENVFHKPGTPITVDGARVVAQQASALTTKMIVAGIDALRTYEDADKPKLLRYLDFLIKEGRVDSGDPEVEKLRAHLLAGVIQDTAILDAQRAVSAAFQNSGNDANKAGLELDRVLARVMNEKNKIGTREAGLYVQHFRSEMLGSYEMRIKLRSLGEQSVLDDVAHRIVSNGLTFTNYQQFQEVFREEYDRASNHLKVQLDALFSTTNKLKHESIAPYKERMEDLIRWATYSGELTSASSLADAQRVIMSSAATDEKRGEYAAVWSILAKEPAALDGILAQAKLDVAKIRSAGDAALLDRVQKITTNLANELKLNDKQTATFMRFFHGQALRMQLALRQGIELTAPELVGVAKRALEEAEYKFRNDSLIERIVHQAFGATIGASGRAAAGQAALTTAPTPTVFPVGWIDTDDGHRQNVYTTPAQQTFIIRQLLSAQKFISEQRPQLPYYEITMRLDPENPNTEKTYRIKSVNVNPAYSRGLKPFAIEAEGKGPRPAPAVEPSPATTTVAPPAQPAVQPEPSPASTVVKPEPTVAPTTAAAPPPPEEEPGMSRGYSEEEQRAMVEKVADKVIDKLKHSDSLFNRLYSDFATAGEFDKKMEKNKALEEGRPDLIEHLMYLFPNYNSYASDMRERGERPSDFATWYLTTYASGRR